MVEASGAIDDIGLLQANLCLTLRQGGDLWEALRYGQAGIEALASVGLTRMEGQARNRVGHTLLAMARWQEAAVAYAEALAIWEPLHHPNRYEAVAGQAVALDHLGRSSEALELVRDVLAFVAREGLGGIVEPVLLLLHCEAVLTGGGDTAAARRVLHQAATWIKTIAARISEDQVRAVFLTKPDHQRLAQRRKLYP